MMATSSQVFASEQEHCQRSHGTCSQGLLWARPLVHANTYGRGEHHGKHPLDTDDADQRSSTDKNVSNMWIGITSEMPWKAEH